MKFQEAYRKVMEEGKKARRPHWFQEKYMTREIVTSMTEGIMLFPEDWEVE